RHRRLHRLGGDRFSSYLPSMILVKLDFFTAKSRSQRKSAFSPRRNGEPRIRLNRLLKPVIGSGKSWIFTRSSALARIADRLPLWISTTSGKPTDEASSFQASATVRTSIVSAPFDFRGTRVGESSPTPDASASGEGLGGRGLILFFGETSEGVMSRDICDIT